MLPWLSRQISDVVSLLFYTMNNVKFNPHLQYIALISSFCLWHLLYLIFSVVNSTEQLLNGVNVNYYRLFCWFCILISVTTYRIQSLFLFSFFLESRERDSFRFTISSYHIHHIIFCCNHVHAYTHTHTHTTLKRFDLHGKFQPSEAKTRRRRVEEFLGPTSRRSAMELLAAAKNRTVWTDSDRSVFSCVH